jgi:hypothetical protein
LATVLWVQFVLGFDLPLAWCLGVIVVSAWANLSVTLAWPGSRMAGQREAVVQLGFDLVQLSVLLGLTGGLATAKAAASLKASTRGLLRALTQGVLSPGDTGEAGLLAEGPPGDRGGSGAGEGVLELHRARLARPGRASRRRRARTRRSSRMPPTRPPSVEIMKSWFSVGTL